MTTSPPRQGTATREPLAIIGMGCRFPGGADSPEALWQALLRGQDAISLVPPDRWDVESFYDPNPEKPGKAYARWGGFLREIDRFDASFFGVSPREAVHLDPQQRLLLEVAWEALEDAGQVPERLSGSDTGVFIGISSHDYADIQVKGSTGGGSGHYASTGVATSIAANRISYFFNFQGPSVAIDTACSSALVAFHVACLNLWSEECRVALVGGVNCLITPEATIAFSKATMLSATGRCRAFDAAADGYVRGEGAGVIVLKPLARALADGDRVYAVVSGSGINQDGRTQGLTLPSRAAQESLLRSVYRRAGIPPQRVHYVEAHGTGTAVGDPIEANAIGSVLGRHRSGDDRLWIGSVKTNIGHLEAASGIAGVIKAALMLRHRQIPPSLHFEKPNPRIDFDDLRVRVPVAAEPWPTAEPGVIGVNSFGFGGTNAHVILSEAPLLTARPEAPPAAPAGAYLLPLSAKTPEALLSLARSWLALVAGRGDTGAPPLTDLCHAAAVRRPHHDRRLSLAFRSTDDLQDQLDAFVHDEARTGMASGRVSPGRAPKIVYVFSGMGPQWWGMARQLLQAAPSFRDAVERCDHLLRPHAGWSLVEEMTADESRSRMGETEIAQPANFALQVALAALWRSWGVEPDAVVGHSAGEVAAAHVAGALGLPDAIRVIYHRSRLQQRTSGSGRMLAVGQSLEAARRIVDGHAGRVAIAAVNSPQSITLSGDADALEEIAQALEQEGALARLLPGEVPYHSHHMDPLQEELQRSLADIAPQSPLVPIYPTASGVPGGEADFGTAYWWSNVREPVAFDSAVRQLIRDGYDTFIELSPQPVLARSIVENLLGAGQKGTVIPSLRREQDDRMMMLSALGTLYTLGHPVDWRRLYPRGNPDVRIPSYPWQRERFWSESGASRHFRLREGIHPLLGRRIDAARPTWEAELDGERVRYLEDHRVQEATVYPAAAYVEMAAAAGREIFGPDPFRVERLEIERPLILTVAGTTMVQTVFDAGEATLSIYGRVRDSSQAWTLQATAKLGPGRSAAGRADSLEQMRQRCASEIPGSDCYLEFSGRGLHYGPTFRGIAALWRGPREALGRVVVPEGLPATGGGYILHPAILDACFQVLIGAVGRPATGHRDEGIYVPVSIGRVQHHGGNGHSELWSHARVVGHGTSHVEAEYEILDAAGNRVVSISGFRCQLLPASRALEPEDLEGWLYEFQWHARARRGALHPPADYLPAPTEIAERLRPEIAQLCEQLGRARHYREIAPQGQALCVSYVLAAFDRLGWAPSPGERVETASLATRLKVVPRYHRLLERMLEILGEEGILVPVDGGVAVARSPDPVDAERQRQAFLARYPEYDAEMELLARCASRLAEVLLGQQEALELLFPDGSLAMTERFYQDSPSLRVYNLIVRQALAAALERLPSGRTVRVLEIGAGTGATTVHALPALPPHRTEYVFSDVSALFTTAARKKFAEFPFVQYELLDIERDPTEQGFDPHSFDLILATDVVHATADLRRTCVNVTRLLAPGGQLLLIEATSGDRLVDLIFGLLSGWWLFSDLDLRPRHPWLSSAAWQGLLRAMGFDDVAVIADSAVPGQSHQSLLLARLPGNTSAPVLPETVPARRGVRLVLADAGGVGCRLAEVLASRGESAILVSAADAFRVVDDAHVEVNPARAADMQALVDWVVARDDGWRSVIHLWSLDEPAPEVLQARDLARAEVCGCIAALHLVQALARADLSSPPRLLLVTRGAQSVGPGVEPVAVAQSPLWGFGRVVLNEHPDLACTMVDLDPIASPEEGERLAAEVLSPDAEREIALRGPSRYVSRLVPIPGHSLRPVRRAPDAPACDQAFSLMVSRPGILDSLGLRAAERRPPDAGEVEIEVFTAGLNFRDVMKAMGVMPAGNDQDTVYGEECAGRIVRVGKGVSGFQPGDDVIALTGGSFGSHVTVSGADVFRKPARLSLEEAATIPSAFATAQYALYNLAHLEAGERVLIHAAAGGVGLAALQLARRVGAEVFATAGSPEKRDFLRSLGVKHVSDSRSLAFADDVMEFTKGRGVDVVLNSLAGEFIDKGLSVLAPGGRFLELGKVDIYRNRRMELLPFRNALSYFAIDMLQVHRDRPALARALIADILRNIEAGLLHPLPLEVFLVSEIAQAFRHMAQAKHIGKIVVSLKDPAARLAPDPDHATLFHADGTYLLTGGLGGFGLALAQWMVRQGARHLALAGRSGIVSPEASAVVALLRRAGARIRVIQCDVVDPLQVERMLGELSAGMPPLRGVFHAAMVLDDAYLTQLDAGRFSAVTAPKILGAWNLHLSTLERPLDFFVLFSSVAAITGSPAQANYVAGNVFLDALAHYRRATGRPALAIDWGSLAEVGYVARHREVNRYLEALGLRPFKPREATAICGHLLRSPLVQVGAMRVDFQTLVGQLPSLAQAPRFSSLLQRGDRARPGSGAEGREGSIRAALLGAGVDERRSLLEAFVRDELARILGAAPARLDFGRPLTDLGIDSLMAVELRNVFELALGVTVPMGLLADAQLTGTRLVERFLEQVTESLSAAVPLASTQTAGAPAVPAAARTA